MKYRIRLGRHPTLFSENLQENNHLGDPGTDGRISE
jgi:hypothetical protein